MPGSWTRRNQRARWKEAKDCGAPSGWRELVCGHASWFGVFSCWRRAEDDLADLPNFVFEINVFAGKGVFDFQGVFGGFAGGVEVELAYFLSERCTFEVQALLFDGHSLLMEDEAIETLGDPGE